MPSRDGSKIAAEDIGSHQLFIYDALDMSKPPETAAPNTDPEAHNLVLTDWSPDGTKILYHLPNVLPSVWTYSLPERTHRRLTLGASAAWLQDGRCFVFPRRGRLYVLDTAQDGTREVLSLPGETINGPRLAVNDTQLFTTITAPPGRVQSPVPHTRRGSDRGCGP